MIDTILTPIYIAFLLHVMLSIMHMLTYLRLFSTHYTNFMQLVLFMCLDIILIGLRNYLEMFSHESLSKY
jgi:hypothetical protein